MVKSLCTRAAINYTYLVIQEGLQERAGRTTRSEDLAFIGTNGIITVDATFAWKQKWAMGFKHGESHKYTDLLRRALQ
jgi:hypothetical protein